MEDRFKRADTVRTQFVCDSALSARSDMNDIELNGRRMTRTVADRETGFDDGSAPRRNQDNRLEANAGSTWTLIDLQIMVQVLCDGTWCQFAAQEIGCSRMIWKECPMCRWTTDSMARRISVEQVALVLVIRERSHTLAWRMLVPR